MIDPTTHRTMRERSTSELRPDPTVVLRYEVLKYNAFGFFYPTDIVMRSFDPAIESPQTSSVQTKLDLAH